MTGWALGELLAGLTLMWGTAGWLAARGHLTVALRRRPQPRKPQEKP